MALLSSDAADVTALYMFLLLYRQLVYSDCNVPPTKSIDANILRLKNEIRDISPTHLGVCFSTQPSSDRTDKAKVKELEKGQCTKQDVVLQVTRRAAENSHSSTASDHPASPNSTAPSERLLSLAQRWADSNIRLDSPLCTMLRHRIRETIFNSVVGLAYPGPAPSSTRPAQVDLLSKAQSQCPDHVPHVTGMESLAEEIKLLADKISRLALIHLNAYLPLYEQDDFLP